MIQETTLNSGLKALELVMNGAKFDNMERASNYTSGVISDIL